MYKNDYSQSRVFSTFKKLFGLSLLAALLSLGGQLQTAHAQSSFQIGPRAGIGVGDYDNTFIGADARIGLGGLPVQFNPTFDYYFLEGDQRNLFNITANALYHFGVDNQFFTPYSGAGLSVARLSREVGEDDTSTALNLLGGAVIHTGSFQPFIQAQFTVGGEPELFSIAGGLLFSL